MFLSCRPLCSFPGSNSDGLIDFDEFRVMDKAFPLLLFPAFKLQDSLQKHFLGGNLSLYFSFECVEHMNCTQ